MIWRVRLTVIESRWNNNQLSIEAVVDDTGRTAAAQDELQWRFDLMREQLQKHLDEWPLERPPLSTKEGK
ncbi:MAG: hypothetical protein WC683_07120 [bacterium]